MAKITITLEVDDTDQTVLYNDLLKVVDKSNSFTGSENEGIKNWCEMALKGKINNAWKRMQREWTDKLMNDDSFTDSIPSNKADFVTLVTARSDYKDRKARDEASKIG